MIKVVIYLTPEEREALMRLAERDVRGLRDQARYLIIRGLAEAEAVALPALPPAQPATMPEAVTA